MATQRNKPATKSRGRPRIEEGQETFPVTVRMTGGQKEKLDRLGGSPWMRSKIDKAREPKE